MLAANYFSRMHALSRDPWGLRTRWHESRKRRITQAALPRRHYDAAFELGCSVGELGATLAPLCDSYLAWDRSRVARKAAARISHTPAWNAPTRDAAGPMRPST